MGYSVAKENWRVNTNYLLVSLHFIDRIFTINDRGFITVNLQILYRTSDLYHLF
jgi:hypothetical protein